MPCNANNGPNRDLRNTFLRTKIETMCRKEFNLAAKRSERNEPNMNCETVKCKQLPIRYVNDCNCNLVWCVDGFFWLLYYVCLAFLRPGSYFYLCETLPNNNGDDYDGLKVCRCAWATYILYINARRTFKTQSNNYLVLWVFDAVFMVHHCCVFFCLTVINQTQNNIRNPLLFVYTFSSQHQDDWSSFNSL